MAAKKKYYVDTKELEAHWAEWLNLREKKLAGEAVSDAQPWGKLCEGIYKICFGVAIHFHPHDEDEHNELAHEAFQLTIQKIHDGRLKFTPGRAPVFNLLTTTVFRHLYSKMNKESRRRVVMTNYKRKFQDEHDHELRDVSQ